MTCDLSTYQCFPVQRLLSECYIVAPAAQECVIVAPYAGCVSSVHKSFSAVRSFFLPVVHFPNAFTAQDMAQSPLWTTAVLRQLALHPPGQCRPPQLGRAGPGPDPGSAAGVKLMPLLVLVLLLQTVTARSLPVMPVTVQTQVLAVMQVWLLILCFTFLL